MTLEIAQLFGHIDLNKKSRLSNHKAKKENHNTDESKYYSDFKRISSNQSRRTKLTDNVDRTIQHARYLFVYVTFFFFFAFNTRVLSGKVDQQGADSNPPNLHIQMPRLCSLKHHQSVWIITAKID